MLNFFGFLLWCMGRILECKCEHFLTTFIWQCEQPCYILTRSYLLSSL